VIIVEKKNRKTLFYLCSDKQEQSKDAPKSRDDGNSIQTKPKNCVKGGFLGSTQRDSQF